MTDRIVIFYGSKKDFEELIARETDKNQTTIPFMELIQHYNARLRPNESGVRESALSHNILVDNCIVRADDYGSVLPTPDGPYNIKTTGLLFVFVIKRYIPLIICFLQLLCPKMSASIFE